MTEDQGKEAIPVEILDERSLNDTEFMESWNRMKSTVLKDIDQVDLSFTHEELFGAGERIQSNPSIKSFKAVTTTEFFYLRGAVKLAFAAGCPKRALESWKCGKFCRGKINHVIVSI